MAAIYVNQAWKSLSNGSTVTVDGVNYTIGTDAFADLSSAVNAASTTEKTTITIASGTYSDSIGFYTADHTVDSDTPADLAAACAAATHPTEQKADIAFVAADGADVTLTGTFIVGYNYRKADVTQEWKSNISFEGVTFDAASADTHSVYIADMDEKNDKGFSLIDCVINGDPDYGIASTTNSSAGPSLIKNCTFKNAALQINGGAANELNVTGSTFTESNINLAGGAAPGVVIENTTFNLTVTDAHANGSFYAIRTNVVPVGIEGCTFNIDSKVSDSVGAQAKWGVLYQRQAGTQKWNVSDITVNYTDAALEREDLFFNLNDSLSDAQDRVVIDGISSDNNNVADILDRTNGYIQIKDGEETLTYNNGNVELPAFDGVTNFGIANIEDFKTFRDMVNAGNTFAGKTITLYADIDLNNEEWAPIGTDSNPFNGVFDGKGHTISNLKIDTPAASSVGLFGRTNNGEIKNFTLHNAQVTGDLNVGAVCGHPYTSKYTNISLTGNVIVLGRAYVGGMLGKNAYANLTDLTVNVNSGSKVQAESGNYRTYVGGVVGFMGEGGHTLKNITSNIDVYGSTCDAGGIVGIAHYGNNFENVSCTAKNVALTDADSEAYVEVGGIAGVWHNQNGYTVTMENVSVGSDLTITATGSDGTDYTEEVKNNTIAGAAYNSGNIESGNSGTLNITATGVKQYISDAVVAPGTAETYSQIVIGDSSFYNEPVQDDGTATAKVTVKGSLVQTGGGYFWIGAEYGSQYETADAEARFGLVIDGGSVNARKTEGVNVRPAGYLDIKNGGSLEASYVVAADSDITASGEDTSVLVVNNNTVLEGASTLTLSDNAVWEVRYLNEAQANVQVGANASVNIESGAALIGTTANANYSNKLINNGTVSVEDGKVSFAVVENNGTFEVAGESTLNIGAFTGTVEIADGATLKDSVVGSSSAFTFNGNASFSGDNNITANTFGTWGSDITVEEGASLTTGVARFSMGGGNTISATGSLAAGTAASLTANELAVTKKTLDLNGLSLVSGGSTLNVENAYVNLGNVSSAKSASGNFAFNFTNSYVTTSVRTVITNNAANIAGLNITLDGSVFAPAAGFTQQAPAAVITLKNGSKLVTATMLNKGTINIDSTSSVQFTGYINNHGGQYGTINVNGGSYSATGSGALVPYQMFDGAVLNVTDGGTFTIDKLTFKIDAGAEVTVEGGSTLALTNAAPLVNAGSITVDVTSSLTGTSLTNDGTITIDAAGFTGERVKVIDLNQASALSGVTLVNGAGYFLDYAADGDVSVVKIPEVLYVNAEWAGSEPGATVDTGKIYGYNAFSSLQEFTAAPETLELVIYGGTYSNVEGDLTDTLFDGGIKTITADGLVTVDKGSLVFNVSEAGEYFLNGDFKTTQADQSWPTWVSNGHMRFFGVEGATMNINGNLINNSGIQFNTITAVLSEDSSISLVKNQWGQMNIYDANVTAYGTIDLNLEVENGSLLNIGKGGNAASLTVSGEKASLSANMANKNMGYYGKTEVNINEAGELNIVDGASFDSTGAVNVKAGAELNISDAEFAAAALTNNGTVNVAGESVLNIGTMTGALKVADDTEISDSAITGASAQILNAQGSASYTDSALTVEHFEVGAYQGTVADTINVELSNTDLTVTGKTHTTGFGGLWVGDVATAEDSQKEISLTVSNGSAVNAKLVSIRDGAELTVTGEGTTWLSNETGFIGDVTVDDKAVMTAELLNMYGNVDVRNGATLGTISGVLNGQALRLRVRGGSTLTVDNASVLVDTAVNTTGSVEFTVYADGQVELKNGADFTVAHVYDAWKKNASGTFTNNGTFLVNTGAFVDMAEGYTFTNAGTVNVDGASFTAATVANNGTFTVAGESTLNIGALKGTILVSDGAVIRDSNISDDGTGSVAGILEADGDITIQDSEVAELNTKNNTVTLAGNVVFSGSRPYNGISVGGYTMDGDTKVWYEDAEFVVAEGANVNTEGIGFFGKHGSLIKIEENATLTAQSQFQNNGDMEVYGTLNINQFGTTAPKLAGTETASSSLGGSLTVDGGTINANVQVLAFGGGQASIWMDATGEYTVTVKNGGKISTGATAFRNTAKNTLVLDNGTLKFVAEKVTTNYNYKYFDNAGVITAKNGSRIDMTDRDSLDNTGIINIESNSSLIADLKGTGVLNFKDTTVTADVTGSQSAVNFLGDVTVEALAVKGTYNFGTARETDPEKWINSNIQVEADINLGTLAYIGSGYDTEVDKTTTFAIADGKTVTASELYLLYGGVVEFGAGSKLIASSYVTTIEGFSLSEGALFQAGAFRTRGLVSIDDAVAVIGYIENTSVEVNSFSLTNGAVLSTGIMYDNVAVSMDLTSVFAVSGNTVANLNSKLDLTIDVSAYTEGTYKLVDMNAKYDAAAGTFVESGSVVMTEDDYKAIIGEENWNENFKVVNSDLLITDAKEGVLYVNADYTGNYGDITADGKLVGINAFDTAKAAFTAAMAAEGGIIDFTDDAYVYQAADQNDANMIDLNVAGTYEVTGGAGSLINREIEVNSGKEEAEFALNFTDAHVTLTKLTLRDYTDASITDSRIDYNIFQGGAAYLSVYRNSSLTISNSTVGFDVNRTGFNGDPADYAVAPAGNNWSWAPTWNIYGSLDVTDSSIYAYVGQAVQAGFDVRGNGTATLTNTEASMALLQVGDNYESKYLPEGTDESSMTATMTVDNTTIVNKQYRGDNVTNNGIVIGSEDGVCKGDLVITNGSDVNFWTEGRQIADARSVGLWIRNEDSSLTLNDSALTVYKVTNAGTIYMDIDSTFTVAGLVSSTGLISVDMTDATAQEYLLINSGDAASVYGTVELNSMDYVSVVDTNGDLYAASLSTITINSAFASTAAGTEVADGFFMGANTFATFETASDAATMGVREFVYVADKTGTLTLNVAATANTNIVIEGVANNMVRAGNTGKYEFSVVAGQSYSINFTTDTGDFDITTSFLDANDAEGEDIFEGGSTSVTDSGYASEGAGAKTYNFTVEEGYIGTLDYYVSNLDGSLRMSIVDGNGNVVKTGLAQTYFRDTVKLTAGDYQIVLESYTGDTVNFDIATSIEFNGAGSADMVSSADNEWTGATVADVNTPIQNWVGMGDTSDWFELTGFSSGVVNMTLDAVDGTTTTVKVYSMDGTGTLTQERAFQATDAAITRYVNMDDSKRFFVNVTASKAGDSLYTITIA